MANAVRALARSLLGVIRVPTYYLPWIARPGLECTLVLSNVEARFKPDSRRGPYTLAVEQYDADGAVVRRHELTLRDAPDGVERPPAPPAGGHGLAAARRGRARRRRRRDARLAAAPGRQRVVQLLPGRHRPARSRRARLADACQIDHRRCCPRRSGSPATSTSWSRCTSGTPKRPATSRASTSPSTTSRARSWRACRKIARARSSISTGSCATSRARSTA